MYKYVERKFKRGGDEGGSPPPVINGTNGINAINAINVRKNSSNTCFLRKCDSTASSVDSVIWQQHLEENLVLNPIFCESCVQEQHFEFFLFQDSVFIPIFSRATFNRGEKNQFMSSTNRSKSVPMAAFN